MSPTQRTQKWLKEHGYQVAHCERKMPASASGWRGMLVTQDLFGFIDTMAVNDEQLLAIQSCSATDHMKRVNKVLLSPVAPQLAYHMDIEVWSWGKRMTGRRLKKTGLLDHRKVWTLRRQALTAQLLPKKSLLRRKLEEGTWDVAREVAKS